MKINEILSAIMDSRIQETKSLCPQLFSEVYCICVKRAQRVKCMCMKYQSSDLISVETFFVFRLKHSKMHPSTSSEEHFFAPVIALIFCPTLPVPDDKKEHLPARITSQGYEAIVTAIATINNGRTCIMS